MQEMSEASEYGAYFKLNEKERRDLKEEIKELREEIIRLVAAPD